MNFTQLRCVASSPVQYRRRVRMGLLLLPRRRDRIVLLMACFLSFVGCGVFYPGLSIKKARRRQLWDVLPPPGIGELFCHCLAKLSSSPKESSRIKVSGPWKRKVLSNTSSSVKISLLT